MLQRKFGLESSLMRDSPGFDIWVGQDIFTHNLKQTALISQKGSQDRSSTEMNYTIPLMNRPISSGKTT